MTLDLIAVEWNVGFLWTRGDRQAFGMKEFTRFHFILGLLNSCPGLENGWRIFDKSGLRGRPVDEYTRSHPLLNVYF